MTVVRDGRDQQENPRGGPSGRSGAGPDAADGTAAPAGATGGGTGTVPWDQRMILGQARGLTWWSAVAFALGLSLVGAAVDYGVNTSFGSIFDGTHFIGCVGAVCLVRRRNLFAPMVQTPLILAFCVLGVVLALGGTNGGGGSLRSQVLTIGTPLINQFPAMAVTTVVTVAVGGYRLYRERRPVGKATSGARPAPPTRTAAGRPAQARGATTRSAPTRGTPTRSTPPRGAPSRGAQQTGAAQRADRTGTGSPSGPADRGRTGTAGAPGDTPRRRPDGDGATRRGEPARRDTRGRGADPRDRDNRDDRGTRRSSQPSRGTDDARARRDDSDPRTRRTPPRRTGDSPRGSTVSSARDRARQIRSNTERDSPRRRDED